MLGGLAVRRTMPGLMSARKPSDLRTEIAPRVAGVTPESAAKAAAVVRARCADDTATVLDMLGLAVTS